jgi:hypothetical protein
MPRNSQKGKKEEAPLRKENNLYNLFIYIYVYIIK